MIDDSDCAFVLDEISTDDEAQVRTVEFTNKKRRGHVLNQAAYRYSIAPKQTYSALLASVVEVNDMEITTVKRTEIDRSNQAIVDAIGSCIGEGINTKMALVREGARHANVSQRTVMEVLDLYTGADPTLHRWRCTVGARGAKLYELLSPQTQTTA